VWRDGACNERSGEEHENGETVVGRG